MLSRDMHWYKKNCYSATAQEENAILISATKTTAAILYEVT